MKKLLILATMLLSAFLVNVSVNAENGWTITDSSGVNTEVCECKSLSGKALHIENIDSDDITVSHLIAGTGTVRRNYRVTFYMNGEYDEEKIMVGTGSKTTASNQDVITYMPVSHDKIEREDYGNGWTKYSYIFRGNDANNSNFKFVFQIGAGEVYLDNVSIVFDSATDGDYVTTGQGILAHGEFEDSITMASGFDLNEFGWTSNADDTLTTGTATAGNSIESIVRVVEADDGNRMLYAKYNADAWSTSPLLLTKTISKTGWEDFYVTFKVKGAFDHGAVMVGSKWEDRLVKLVGGTGSSGSNPHGDNVVAETLDDGWTKYTIKTYGEGTEIKIKIYCKALEIYFDDFEVVTAEGKKIDVDNPGFEGINYDEETAFAEGWTAHIVDKTAFVQRDKMLGGYAVFMKSDNTNNKSGFYQYIDGITVGETYTVSFNARTGFEKCGIKVGFGDNLNSITGNEFTNIEKTVENYTFTLTATSKNIAFATINECNGIWIDNVSVKDAQGNELVVNGDFETKSLSPTYTVKKFKLLKGNAESEIGAGSFVLSVDIENNYGPEGMEFTMIVSHDRNGEMIKYTEKSITLDPNGEDDEPTSLISNSIDLSDYVEGDALEVYIWDNDTDMNSLAPYVCFN